MWWQLFGGPGRCFENTLLLSNELTDYLERHPALVGLSAYEVKAFIHKVKPRQGHMNSVSHLRFGERHPQKASHCHTPLPKYKIPQMYCRWPEEPNASADEEERDAYAAFVLGLFSAYAADDLRVGGWARATPNRSLWDIYISWRDERFGNARNTASILTTGSSPAVVVLCLSPNIICSSRL